VTLRFVDLPILICDVEPRPISFSLELNRSHRVRLSNDVSLYVSFRQASSLEARSGQEPESAFDEGLRNLEISRSAPRTAPMLRIPLDVVKLTRLDLAIPDRGNPLLTHYAAVR
jgi:hypothetical protein